MSFMQQLLEHAFNFFVQLLHKHKAFLDKLKFIVVFSHNRLSVLYALWYSKLYIQNLCILKKIYHIPFQISWMWLNYDVLLNFLFPFKLVKAVFYRNEMQQWIRAGIRNSNQSLEMALFRGNHSEQQPEIGYFLRTIFLDTQSHLYFTHTNSNNQSFRKVQHAVSFFLLFF